MADAAALVRTYAGGRLSLDDASGFGKYGNFARTIRPPVDPEGRWRVLQLDSRTLDRISARDLIDLLADLSPEFSRAMWDFLRLCNPGFEIIAYKVGTKEPDDAAQAAVDAFLSILEDLYGSLDVIMSRSFIAVYMRGAFLHELVLDERGREPIDLVTIDPWAIRFRKVPDDRRGSRDELGQWQGGQFVALDRPTIRYLPIDPFPNSPYGRPLATPALFTCVFLIVMLHDIRRVVQQQGWPRIDIQINIDKLVDELGSDFVLAENKKDVLDKITQQVINTYEGLGPDSAYVHTDVVTVNRAVGTVDGDSLGSIDKLIDALTRMATRALKTMPLMMAITDGVSEANANRQWEIQAAGIKAIQHTLETSLKRLFVLALRAQGILADIGVRFAEIRSSEIIRDAQGDALIIQNAFFQYMTGAITFEEYCQIVAKHDPPEGVTEPLMIPSNWTSAAGDANTVQPDPGANRVIGAPAGWRQWGKLALPPGADASTVRETFKPVGVYGDLPLLPPDTVPEEYTASEKSRVLAVWDDAMPEYDGLLDAEVTGEAGRFTNGAAH